MPTFFEPKYSFCSVLAKCKIFEAGLKASNYLPRANSTAFKRHIHVAMNVLQFSAVLNFFPDDAPDVYGVLFQMTEYLKHPAIRIPSRYFMFLSYFIKSPNRPNGGFVFRAFNKVGAYNFSMLRENRCKLCCIYPSLFASLGFIWSLDFGVVQSKSFKSKNIIPNSFQLKYHTSIGTMLILWSSSCTDVCFAKRGI